MEIILPSAYISASNWLFEEKTKWTPAENKAFENALAVFDKDTNDRWYRLAEMVPGKSVLEVMMHYKELEDDVNSIEAGLFPIPGYAATSPFTLEWGSGHDFDEFKQSGKRSSSKRPSEQERKKGIPWTEEEHKLFLMGLKKYGKGDWRNISRNYVITRTPTQVASHAQKYFMRQLSGGKDKKRASIHDITTSSLNDNQMASQKPNSTALRDMPFICDLGGDEETVMSSNTNSYGNTFMYSHGGKSCDVKFLAQNMKRGAMYDSYLGFQDTAFQML